MGLKVYEKTRLGLAQAIFATKVKSKLKDKKRLGILECSGSLTTFGRFKLIRALFKKLEFSLGLIN